MTGRRHPHAHTFHHHKHRHTNGLDTPGPAQISERWPLWFFLLTRSFRLLGDQVGVQNSPPSARVVTRLGPSGRRQRAFQALRELLQAQPALHGAGAKADHGALALVV
jgi:hypothetical protein